MSGRLFQQEQNKRQCRNVTTKPLPWLGQPWLNRLTKKLKDSATRILICSTNVISSTCHAIVHVAADHDKPTYVFASIVSSQFRHWLRAIRENVYYLQICSKGVVCCALNQIKISAKDKSLDSRTFAFLIIQQGSRATEEVELLFPGCFQIVFAHLRLL